MREAAGMDGVCIAAETWAGGDYERETPTRAHRFVSSQEAFGPDSDGSQSEPGGWQINVEGLEVTTSRPLSKLP